ncbi:sigma-70 family RNA polymerase sigma factor [Candidatus Peregrinibacteria bacterium]|nr:sigma-70 family RNA polymerase sigma factor [Candidatus Peregrinibacteria bacterium]
MAENAIPNLDVWVQKSQKGDTEAFGHIYDALVKPIYRYIYYRVDPEIAEDLTEETFLKIWQNLKKYKKGSHPFSSWVFRIAHNLVCDYYRKHQPIDEMNENTPDPHDHLNPVKSMSVKLDGIRLRKALKKLPENYQQVIILKYINGLENPEIATAVGKSEGAIRTLQFRALAQLRVILGEKRKDF